MSETRRSSSARRRIATAAAAFALVASLFAVAPASVLAAVTPSGGLTGGTGMPLDTSSASATRAWTPLGGSAGFTSDAPGDFVTGTTITLVAPAGFQFDATRGSVVNGCSGSGVNASLVPTSAAMTISIVSGYNSGSCSVAVTGLWVQPTGTTPTSGSITAQYNVTSPAPVGTLSSVTGAPARLDFTTAPPANTTAGATFAPSVRVSDQFGNLVASASDTVTLGIVSSGSGILTCASTTVATAVGTGTAYFSGCSLSIDGTYTVRATSAHGYTQATSGVVVGGVVGLTKLVFHTQPGSATTTGTPLSQQPVVWYVDASGTIIDNSSLVVSLAVTPGTGTSGAAVSCSPGTGTSVTTLHGIASFGGCTVSLGGAGYTLTASGGSVPGAPTPATSTAFNVGNGVPDHLVFAQTPTDTTIGSLLSPAPAVQVVDIGGYAVPGYYRVTLTLIAGPGSGNLTCANNPDYTNSGTGRLTFTACSVSGPGTFFLQATAPGVSGGASGSFVIGSGSSAQVAFAQQPLGAALGGTVPVGGVGVAWTIQPRVAVQNTSGQTITSDNGTQVTLSITPSTPLTGGPGTLTCTGGTTATVSAGVATFSGCAISPAGTGYQLRATVLTSATIPVNSRVDSLAFNIGASVTTQLAFTTQPLGAYTGSVPTGAVGIAWSIQPVVAVRTLTGATITSDYTTQVTLSITPGTPTSGVAGVLTCAGGNTRTAVAGLATFSGCSISAAGTAYQLRATAVSSTTIPTNTTVDSYAFTIGGAVASTIRLTTYPSVVTWGDPFTLTIQFSVPGAHAYTVQRLSPIDHGQYVNILTGTTDSTGKAVKQYSPRFNGTYKIVFAGDATAGAGTSNVTTVNVRNLVLLRPSWTGTKTVSAGFVETYTATVRPVPSGGLPGGVASVSFEFWKITNGTWAKVKAVTVPLSSSGVGSLKYAWITPGQWYIRARTLPNIYNFWGTSVVQRINVQ